MSSRGSDSLDLLLVSAFVTLIGVAGWHMFDVVVRAQSASQAQGGELRALQRALRLFERDVRHAVLSQGARSGYGMTLHKQHLQWRRGGERN